MRPRTPPRARARLNYANVVATVTLFLALTGGALAAAGCAPALLHA